MASPAGGGSDLAWQVLALSRVGESHRRHGIVCQDHCAAAVAGGTDGWSPDGEGGWAYLVVSDGHGSERYFRSHKGAELAVEALQRAFRELKGALLDPPEVDGPDGSAGRPGPPPADHLHQRHWKAWAPRFVVSEWRAAVYRDLTIQPPDLDVEEPGLERMLDKVREKDGHRGLQRMYTQLANFKEHARERGGENVRPSPLPLPLPTDAGWDAEALGSWQAIAYGATLLGVLVGPAALYWFQLGDGAMAQIVGGEPTVLVPAPTEAIANETPSLCADDAVNAVRVGTVPLVQGHIPSAVILTSDGVPNSFTEPDGFSLFCSDITRRVQVKRENVEDRLPEWLDELSRRGSCDDMTVAMAWATEAADPSDDVRGGDDVVEAVPDRDGDRDEGSVDHEEERMISGDSESRRRMRAARRSD